MAAWVLLPAALDGALALLVFALFARPEAFLGWFAAMGGEGRAWDEGRLDARARERLLRLAHRAAWGGLLVLFGFSFAVGAWLALVRL